MSAARPNPLAVDPDLMPVALVKLDDKLRIQALNTGGEILFGLSRQSGRGRELSELIYHDSTLFTLIEEARQSGQRVSATSLTIEGPALKASGAHAGIIVRTEEGGFALTLVANTNTEPASADSEGLATFGRMLGHEVKNPLAGISGAAQLLLRKAEGGDQRELLGLVIAESQRIARLVDKFSAFELFSAPSLVPCNVHVVLEQVLRAEEIGSPGNVRFARNFDPSLPDISGDCDHLHEAVQNIVRNAGEAIRASSVGDTITVSTRFALGKQLAAASHPAGTRAVEVSICDNGAGIPSDLQTRIFDMFQTTKPSGGGLGLTIASQIIAAHHGAITLDSRPGHTEFSLYLPIAKDRP